MQLNVNRKTPSPPPTKGSPGGTTADGIRQLSLDNRSFPPQSRGARGILRATPVASSKRAASSELHRPPGRRSPAATAFRTSQAGALRHQRPPNRSQRRTHFAANQNHGHLHHQHIGSTDSQAWSYKLPPILDQFQGSRPTPPVPRHSGYDTLPSRCNTLQPDLIINPADDEYVSVEPLSNPARSVGKGKPQQIFGSVSLVRSKSRWPGLILQPESSPISHDQLAAEIKGIYAGLVMVEAKCINIDAAQAADPGSTLGPEQWQALIALHRTLLYEHHDFLMATQHPSATQALRGLAHKYSMPARMWRHGIHAFLEVLRHRRPHSQDYMVSFVILAYQMMALLYETVPSFLDTWIECLGDLARYRMAIEEDKEIHAIWGGVAASWYTIASDRHPSIGRLYHHLGILERPGIRKLFLYSKSLTCVIPFPNARDSLATLCSPFVENGHTGQSGMRSAEACVVKFHAFNFIDHGHTKLPELIVDAVAALDQCPTVELRDTGVYIVVANIAALFEHGAPNNVLWQLYGNAINADVQAARPSASAAEFRLTGSADDSSVLPTKGTYAPPSSYDFLQSCFHASAERASPLDDVWSLGSVVHVTLVWMHSLTSLWHKSKNEHDTHTLRPLLSTGFPWGGLCNALNLICEKGPIDPRIMEYARQGIFPKSGTNCSKPLPEDGLLRGLIWTQWYYPQDFFGDQDSNEVSQSDAADQAIQRSREDRILWLALYQVFHGDHIKFDDQNTRFWAQEVNQFSRIDTSVVQGTPITATATAFANLIPPNPPSPTTSSPESDSDGFMLVEAPKSKSKTFKTWANVVSNSDQSLQSDRDIRVVDDEEMRWVS